MAVSQRSRLTIAVMVLSLWPQTPAMTADKTPAEPAGYRMEDYKAPVPVTLHGALVITTADAEKLWKTKAAVFLDVMPRLPKPEKLPAGTIWRDKKRENIPDSIWLANVGYGALNAEMEQYFRGSLEKLTSGDKSRPLVFYCMSNCWMSWNAAKRALSWGYLKVSWYPEGADGWQAAKLPLAEAEPYADP